MIKMAIEVGGTFTDLIWIEGDHVRSHKLPSTPHDASIGVIDGLSQSLGADLPKLTHLFHGSTVATNAVIERKGCRAAFLTTRGFRDLLVLQRQLRPNVYAIACEKPEPLIPLKRSVEVTERMDVSGQAVLSLDEDELCRTIDQLIEKEKPEALAVCLLHSYRNPEHEQTVRRIVNKRYPDLPVVLSSDVLPTFREYERASTTVMAAYLVPLVGRYLRRLEDHLGDRAPGSGLFVMQSSGGVLPSSGSHGRGVEMLNSGPAAGVIGATRMAGLIGDRNVITLDVGGTSADICLIANGVPGITAETEVDGLPVGLPSVDIANIGAGGGSIGWIDEGGMLQVGPRSAGARPGPACYGHGASAPALTDALVRLGWIRPHRFLGGRMTLHPEQSDQALKTLAEPLGQNIDEMAQAMVDISTAHISQGIRLVSVQRGHDPRDYSLYGYGGMGPMISALSASDLKIRRVVIPPYPGLFSALGLLVADVKRIYRETRFLPVDGESSRIIASTFRQMQREPESEFVKYGYAAADIVYEHALEMRYAGQGFELLATIDLDRLDRDGVTYLREVFGAAHQARYGSTSRAAPMEIVTFRLTAHIPTPSAVLNSLTRMSERKSEAEIEEGQISFGGRKIPCRFAWRSSLASGSVVKGAAVIEEPTATTFVPPGWMVTVDKTGALILTPES
jgi:N-methylhydantoinase A